LTPATLPVAEDLHSAAGLLSVVGLVLLIGQRIKRSRSLKVRGTSTPLKRYLGGEINK